MKFKRYTFGNAPDPVPLLRRESGWNKDLVTDAGFDPSDYDVVVCELAEDWNGHPKGATAICTFTTEGLPFAIEVDDETDETDESDKP